MNSTPHSRDEMTAGYRAAVASPPLAHHVYKAAELAGVSRATLYQEIKSGRLRTFKVGARRLISSDALRDWIRDREVETGQEAPT